MDDFHCSFCGKRRREVLKLISGPRVFICNECVALCVGILEKEKAAEAARLPLDVHHRQSEEKGASLHCSFCGKPQRDVEVLIAGGEAWICNECLEISVEIVEEARKGQSQPPGSGSSA